MATGKTEKGFCFDVDETKINSWKTTRLVACVTDEETNALVVLSATFKLADIILGTGKQQEDFIEFLDNYYGREASYEEVLAELFEIYKLARTDSKN